MKRIVAILLAVMLLAAAIPAVSFAETVSNASSKSTVYRMTGNKVNLRAGAGTKYKSLAKLAKGAAISVLQSSGKWYRVKVLKSGKVGWVSKNYTAFGAYARVTTKNQGLNVRSGAGTGYRIKGSLPKGAKNVLVRYYQNGWAYVKYGKLEGWVCLQGKYSYPLLTWNA